MFITTNLRVWNTTTSIILLVVICLAAVVVVEAAASGNNINAIPQQQLRSFGHSIKNGKLPPNVEVTIFEHECNDPPCVITHISIPAIYPPHTNNECNYTSQGDITFYLDHDDNSKISVTTLELAGESARFNHASAPNGKDMSDFSPWGIDMMGRTAKSGGVYSTIRIPFQKHIRITIQSPDPCPDSNKQNNSNSKGNNNMMTYWMVVRGLEGINGGIVLGDLVLPKSAQLKLARVPPTSLASKEFITLATEEDSPTKNGALLRLQWDASGPDWTYLEGCLRMVTPYNTTTTTTGNTTRTNSNKPPKPGVIFLSSGTEDYFLGASYFDAGPYQTPNAGVTYLDKHSYSVAAYKTHTYDPIVFHNGFKIVLRNNEITKGCGGPSLYSCCPNQYCRSNSTKEEEQKRENPNNLESSMVDDAVVNNDEPVIYSSLLWYYVWDNDDDGYDDGPNEDDNDNHITSHQTMHHHQQQKKEECSHHQDSPSTTKIIQEALAQVAKLRANDVISDDEENDAIDRLLMGQDRMNLAMLLTSYSSSDEAAAASLQQTGRVLIHFLERTRQDKADA